jgi:nucleoside 2-deoxyribosyltransferase
MLKVYIIGPYRSDSSWQVEQNIREAEDVAAILWNQGFSVFCPHTNTRFFNTGVAPDSTFLEGDLEWLKQADLAVAVGQWKFSKGSCREIDFCMEHKIPYFIYSRDNPDIGLTGCLGNIDIDEITPSFMAEKLLSLSKETEDNFSKLNDILKKANSNKEDIFVKAMETFKWAKEILETVDPLRDERKEEEDALGREK